MNGNSFTGIDIKTMTEFGEKIPMPPSPEDISTNSTYSDSIGFLIITVSDRKPKSASGVIAVLIMEAGLITPRLGLNIFVISGVAYVPMETVFKGSVFFLPAIFAVVFLITLFPQIALFLPGIMGR